jgi:hypothetical protein
MAIYFADVYYVSVPNSVERDSPLTKFPLTDSAKAQIIENLSPSTSLVTKPYCVTESSSVKHDIPPTTFPLQDCT